MNESMSSEHDRTEPASQFKLSEARKHGQVAKSLDVNSFVMILALILILTIAAGSAWQKICRVDQALLMASANYASDNIAVMQALSLCAHVLCGVLAMPLCAGAIAAILGNVLQTGPVFSFAPLKPKFERLNPVAGFKRVFTKRLLIETVKSILKLTALISVSYTTFSARWRELSNLTVEPVVQQINWLANMAIVLLFRLLLVLLVFALIDLALVRWQFAKQMRMSRRDIKEEVKRREGDPLIRSKIRQLQKENLKQSKSLSRVADADVLITNPTHFAVALRYVRGEMSAPNVIAKGSERWAHDMRVLAAKNNVPILERKRLARKLFRHASVDRPVPSDTFLEVARLYADLGAYRRKLASNRVEVPA
ncbi:MAG: EscU/YscU/HrcU family type III secretion system export apparatus switch protein [Steroidobacter sp.]